MAGLLTHLLVSSALFFLVLLIFRKWHYSVVAFLGQLMPDLINWGVPALRYQTLEYSRLASSPLLHKLVPIIHSPKFWALVLLAVVVLTVITFCFKVIGKKTRNAVIISAILFFIGNILHLIIDNFIIETSPWV